MQSIRNESTSMCEYTTSVNSKGYFLGGNPLFSSAPLVMLQLAIFAILAQTTHLCLRPLSQVSFVSSMIGGILLGPSVLGNTNVFSNSLFPSKSLKALDIISTLGLMFFLFLCGVRTEPSMITQSGRKAMSIGFSVVLIPLALSSSLALILKRFLSMDQNLAESLPYFAGSQAITSFAVITCVLTELKILNTDLGRLATSTALVTDLLGMSSTAVGIIISQGKGDLLASMLGLFSVIGLLVFVVFFIRPGILWVIKKTPDGDSVKEVHILAILLAVLGSGFVSQRIGQQVILGPLILGLSVPHGPPLGTALISKLDSLVSGVLFPSYLAVSGLRTNMLSIRLWDLWIMGIIVIFSCMVKLASVMLPCHQYYDMPLQEAFVLGLIINSKGITEIITYNVMKENKVLNEEEFSIVVVIMILVSAIVTPLIKAIYDPSKRYLSSKNNTIQHAKCDEELRLLVCVHKQDNVPAIINLLEVSHATEESPISVVILQLIDLMGRSIPILIPYQPQSTLLLSSSAGTDQIINAFRKYESHNQGFVTIEPFISIAHLATMHDDICNVAHNKSVSMVIIPFHRQWAIDGKVGSDNHTIRVMNRNILSKAPSSVGILVDRNVLSGSISVLASQTSYRVAVLFMGGADDEEALAYGVRMANHHHVNLTVIRFLAFGGEYARERKLDSDMINEFKHNCMGNKHIKYIEEVVKDGEELAAIVRSMDEGYDLFMVGRHQRKQYSKLLRGLNEWSECPELGIVGDMLASQDFRGMSSVLIVQQQARQRDAGLVNRVMPLEVDAMGHGGLHREIAAHHDATWTIAMDRNFKV